MSEEQPQGKKEEPHPPPQAAEPPPQPSKPWVALHSAAHRGDLQAIQKAIAEGADLLVRDKIGGTALHIAAQRGHAEVVEALVEAKVPVDVEQNDKQSPLHLAIRAHNLPMVKKLLELKANVTHADMVGEVPLHLAVRLDTRKTPTEEPGSILDFLLLEHKVSIDCQNPKNWETALHVAALLNNSTMVRYLIEKHDASPLVDDKDFFNPIDRANFNEDKSDVVYMMRRYIPRWKYPDPNKPKKAIIAAAVAEAEADQRKVAARRASVSAAK